jgi:hypothetical protein
MTTASPSRAPLVLGLLFFAFYMAFGLALYFHAPRLFRYLDQVFDADVPSRVIDLTHARGGHERTQFHPLFVLILNPIGTVLRAALRAAGASAVGSERLAAVFMCASAGGVTVALFFRLLGRLGCDRTWALLGTLIFGLSASEILFASVPELFPFSALALVLLFYSCAGDHPPKDGLVLTGVLAFSMVVTNIVAVVLARSRWLSLRPPLGALRALALFTVVVVTLTAGLSVVQSFLYPGTVSFLRIEPLAGPDRHSFVWPSGLHDAAQRAQELFAYFMVFDLAAPRLVVTELPPRTVVDFPDVGLAALRGIGMAQVTLWLGLLVTATGGWRRYREPPMVALGLWVAFNVLLHSVFGTSLFLYSCQWTFAVVGLVVVALCHVSRQGAMRRSLLVATTVLVGLQGANNLQFMADLLRAFATRSQG